MKYALPVLQYGLSCVEICEGEEPLPVDAAFPVLDLPGYDMIIENGVLREKTIEEKEAYQTAVSADLAYQEEVWQLQKSPTLKALENIYVDFLTNMWTQALRTAGLIPEVYTITVDNTDEATNMYLLMQLRAINFSVYESMSNEFLKLKTAINQNGGIMSKVKLHT